MTLSENWSNVPVTALCFLETSHTGSYLLLAGEGTCLKIFDPQTARLTQKVQIFQETAIQGIVCVSSGSEETIILVWGGQRLCQVRTSFIDTSSNFQITHKDLVRLPSWIFSVVPNDSTSDGKVAVITADNVLYLFSQDLTLDHTIHDLQVDLYSASLQWLDEARVLVASGTVFGEVIAWSGFTSGESEFYNTFVGHEGSIFGVTISGLIRGRRFIASCSDDRTIRLWDVTTLVPQLKSSAEDKETGFRKEQLTTQSQTAALGWGHTSRIWGLHFLRGQLRLVSFGEDATCKLWSIPESAGTGPESVKLQCTGGFHEHVGKNVWSIALRQGQSGTELASGGADGKIALLQLHELLDTTLIYGFEDVTSLDCEAANVVSLNPAMEGVSTRQHKSWKSDYLKKVIAFGNNKLLLASNEGVLSVVSLEPTLRVERCSRVEAIKGYSLFSEYHDSGHVCFAGGDQGVYLYSSQFPEIVHLDNMPARVDGVFLRTDSGFDNQDNQKVICPVVSIALPQKAIALKLDTSGLDVHITILQKISLELPHGFRITAACWVPDFDVLVLGSRRGAVAVYKLDSHIPSAQESLSALACARHVHGDDGVSCIRILPHSTSQGQIYIATTGRDGTYAVQTLDVADEHLKLVHSSAPPLGPMLEGVTFTPSTILYGFRLTQFVVYNESEEQELAVVDCGGANRSWALLDDRLVWFQHGNLQVQKFEQKRTIQRGGHGREIKTMAISKANGLVATGAEDTTIKIWGRLAAVSGRMRVLRTLKKHTAGMQALAWSKDGRYLFSSAGLEEFYVWRVTIIPGSTSESASAFVGVVCEASLPKFSDAEDLRITAFNILEDEDVHKERILIGMVCSDSTMRVYSYHLAEKSFTLLSWGIYRTCCLTQVEFLRLEEKVYLFTAATDGHVQIWKLPPLSTSAPPNSLLNESQPSAAETSDVTENILETATRGSDVESKVSWKRAIHQNSIKALKVIPCDDFTLLVTGGDDNALAITAIRLSEDSDLKIQSSTILLPNAHAASLTAIDTISGLRQSSTLQASAKASADISDDGNELSLSIATSGNDQRLKIWDVIISTSPDAQSEDAAPAEIGLPRLSLRRRIDRHTSVADISSLEVWKDAVDADKKGGEDQCYITVAGVGIESWKLGDL